MPKFIGIKQLWYGPVMTTAPTGKADLQALVEGQAATYTEVKNVHQDTWGYQQDDPSVDDYINQLTGNPYYRDMNDAGRKTITFSMGEYDFQSKADLQGGTVITSGSPATPVGWAAPTTRELIEKGIIALTKTGGWICFTNASIVAKGDQQQKAIGLGVTAVAQDNPNAGVSDEYFFV